jgi:hypothetical protein
MCVAKHTAWSTLLRKTQKYATQELGPSASETSNLDVCLHVTTNNVNKNISMILDKEYVNIFLVLMSILFYTSILLYTQLLLYGFDAVHVKCVC